MNRPNARPVTQVRIAMVQYLVGLLMIAAFTDGYASVGFAGSCQMLSAALIVVRKLIGGRTVLGAKDRYAKWNPAR